MSETRLTGRDVLAKTFQAKTKRGFDPVEVDAYLELVAAQVDMLHGDLARVSDAADTATVAVAPHGVDVDAITESRDQLAIHVTDLQQQIDALTAENDQLRQQATAVAPPPPSGAVEPSSPAHAAGSEVAVASDPAEKGEEESFELVLRMARRSAEETISEAHARADEIVADANFTAAQISRESDRKAFESANVVQAELASINERVEAREGELEEIETRASEKRQELRDIAQRILLLADAGDTPDEGAEVVDLRPQPTEHA